MTLESSGVPITADSLKTNSYKRGAVRDYSFMKIDDMIHSFISRFTDLHQLLLLTGVAPPDASVEDFHGSRRSQRAPRLQLLTKS
ncbi:hypothetical protein EVAR_89775_1 [Eumeta japonica]|uniref:Uncharacterized protein n=1 Tax=Eumeta variegata TaxID=151549 RepID=A0A4C1XFN4_EUMVA|nr:hypothetical protein EVAR_89775_1 [Eumeta japonica]